MTDFAPALARLQLALDQSGDLQRGLSRRQDDLLGLEEAIQGASAGDTTVRVLIDQAEDIRRAVRNHADLQLTEVRDALTHARGALIDALVEGAIPSGIGKVLLHVVDRAASEGDRGAATLDGVARALGRTSQASLGEPDLSVTARQSVDEAANLLESARRSVFRVSEDLPTLERAVWEAAVGAGSAAEGRPPQVPRVAAEPTLSGVAYERREPPGLGNARAGAVQIRR